jgi:enoyl-CoA hydratase/carnithine racemase
MWHQAFERIEFGRIPVIAVLKGAVIGGGLELAAAAHIRIAEETTYYGLPEGQRGIFVGGGGAVRIPRLIGVARMMDMMLTGRTYDAAEGAAAGLSQYLVPAGAGMAKAIELAEVIVDNAPLTNFAVMHALPRIAETDRQSGLVFESLMAAIAQSDPLAKARMRDFIEKKASKVKPPR